MNIIVVGCGRVGAELAMRLQLRNHRVVVVDSDPSQFINLPPEFNGRTVEGEALNRDVLRRAGIENTDALAAVTSSDAINLAIAHIARRKFNIVNVVVRNFDSSHRRLFEVFDYQVVSATTWGAQRIEELLYHLDMRTVFSAGNGEVEVYELTVPPSWDQKPLSDLFPVAETIPTALSRRGQAVLPEQEMTLQTGDVLLVSATIDGIERLREKLLV